MADHVNAADDDLKRCSSDQEYFPSSFPSIPPSLDPSHLKVVELMAGSH